MSDKCPKCGSKKVTETILEGVTQVVKWEGDYVLSEVTFYDKKKKSTYTCTDCNTLLDD